MAKIKNIKQKVKEHKKEIIVSGIVFATCAGLLIGIKNRDLLINLCKNNTAYLVDSDEVKKTISTVAENQLRETGAVGEMALEEGLAKRTFEVSGHIRNLSMGRHASQAKIDIAKAQGIELLEGQTLVDTYTKGLCAA